MASLLNTRIQNTELKAVDWVQSKRVQSVRWWLYLWVEWYSCTFGKGASINSDYVSFWSNIDWNIVVTTKFEKEKSPFHQDEAQIDENDRKIECIGLWIDNPLLSFTPAIFPVFRSRENAGNKFKSNADVIDEIQA